MFKDHHKLWRLHGEIWGQKDPRLEGNLVDNDLTHLSNLLTCIKSFLVGHLGWVHACSNDISCQSSWTVHNRIPKPSRHQRRRRDTSEYLFLSFLQVTNILHSPCRHSDRVCILRNGNPVPPLLQMVHSFTELLQIPHCQAPYTDQNCINLTHS